MSRTVRSLLPIAEIALIGLSLSVVVGFARLFDDGSFFARLAAFAVVAHLAALVARRAGWSVAASGVLSLIALGLTVGVALYPETTLVGLPTGDTLQAARTARTQYVATLASERRLNAAQISQLDAQARVSVARSETLTGVP